MSHSYYVTTKNMSFIIQSTGSDEDLISVMIRRGILEGSPSDFEIDYSKLKSQVLDARTLEVLAEFY